MFFGLWNISGRGDPITGCRYTLVFSGKETLKKMKILIKRIPGKRGDKI
jgi:hypothetical protein